MRIKRILMYQKTSQLRPLDIDAHVLSILFSDENGSPLADDCSGLYAV